VRGDPLDPLLDARNQVATDLAGMPALMRTPAGWDTGPTRLAEHLVYLLLSGSALAESGGARWRLEPGSLAIFPPGCTFRVQVADHAPTVLRCRIRVARGLRPQACLERPLVLPSAGELRPTLQQLVDEAQAPGSDHQLRVRALAILLLSGARRPLGDQAGGGRFSQHQQLQIATLVAERLSAGLHPRDLARHLGLSLDYCTRRFQRTYGLPPRRWLVRERMHAACTLLAAGRHSVAAVAAAVGSGDANLFARQFRQVLGVAPGRWRDRHGAGALV
jgi:AraC-like DNA-binding protein